MTAMMRLHIIFSFVQRKEERGEIINLRSFKFSLEISQLDSFWDITSITALEKIATLKKK